MLSQSGAKVWICLEEGSIFPTRATVGSACYDIYSNNVETIQIVPGETISVRTGLRVYFSDNFVLKIFSRSGLAKNYGIALANGVGIIDSDYRGEISLLLHNNSKNTYKLERHTRCAQFMLEELANYQISEISIDEYKKYTTTRSDGGFGSTGTK